MKSPSLTSKIMNDEDALGLAIDEVLLRSKSWHNLNRRVRKVQRKMRRLMNYDAWVTYLQLEEIVNERAFIEGNLLVKWAFESRRS